MTQLIINGTEYPETTRDKYKCYLEESGVNLEMLSGRMVTEIGYTKVVIEYSFDYLKDDLMRQCLSDLRSNADLVVEYLSPERDELQSGIFRCIKKPAPTYAFSRGGKPVWRGIAFTLKGVDGIA